MAGHPLWPALNRPSTRAFPSFDLHQHDCPLAGDRAAHHIPSMEKLHLSDEEWQRKLTPMQYHVLRQAGTERAFTGELNANKAKGTYYCAGCGTELFTSDTKYDSGSGWPSFYAPADPEAVDEHSDTAHGMVRTEVRCATCEGHLGHVFPDGPAPTGLRYCMNSAALDFEAEEGK